MAAKDAPLTRERWFEMLVHNSSDLTAVIDTGARPSARTGSTNPPSGASSSMPATSPSTCNSSAPMKPSSPPTRSSCTPPTRGRFSRTSATPSSRSAATCWRGWATSSTTMRAPSGRSPQRGGLEVPRRGHDQLGRRPLWARGEWHCRPHRQDTRGPGHPPSALVQAVARCRRPLWVSDVLCTPTRSRRRRHRSSRDVRPRARRLRFARDRPHDRPRL